MTRLIGKLGTKSTALLLCDMQEKFRTTIFGFPQIIEVSSRMLNAAKHLDMPIVVTEQYPKGLGSTVSELNVTGLPVFPKTCFSMVGKSEVQKYLDNIPDLKSVILCGIEAHVCVQQTAFDLLDQNKDVHIIADAVSSRNIVDRMFALQRMKDAGAFITTSESMILALARDAAHPKFKELQKLIWDKAPDSGLLSYSITEGT